MALHRRYTWVEEDWSDAEDAERQEQLRVLQEQLRRSASTWWSIVGDVVAHHRRTPGAPRSSLGATSAYAPMSVHAR